MISNKSTDSCATNRAKATASGQYGSSDGADSCADCGVAISG
ncbi:hypothetical protein APV28_3854 [Comamonas testosteroni]|nr:hypothetical protein APV28_3854 [Comamonas testosteroni]